MEMQSLEAGSVGVCIRQSHGYWISRVDCEIKWWYDGMIAHLHLGEYYVFCNVLLCNVEHEYQLLRWTVYPVDGGSSFPQKSLPVCPTVQWHISVDHSCSFSITTLINHQTQVYLLNSYIFWLKVDHCEATFDQNISCLTNTVVFDWPVVSVVIKTFKIQQDEFYQIRP